MIDVFSPQPPSMRTIAAICRCSSPAVHAQRERDQAADSDHRHQARIERNTADQIAAANKRAAEIVARTPNPDDYLIERVERFGANLVMQVRYPSCKACAFEGLKTMVFLAVDEAAALRWRRIDPHFRGPTKDPREAPSPAARYPGTPEGWNDAVDYARSKT